MKLGKAWRIVAGVLSLGSAAGILSVFSTIWSADPLQVSLVILSGTITENGSGDFTVRAIGIVVYLIAAIFLLFVKSPKYAASGFFYFGALFCGQGIYVLSQVVKLYRLILSGIASGSVSGMMIFGLLRLVLGLVLIALYVWFTFLRDSYQAHTKLPMAALAVLFLLAQIVTVFIVTSSGIAALLANTFVYLPPLLLAAALSKAESGD
ncbi:MAG: hypothetical protein LBJ11_11730 [Oscillospiraceae bacterium]|nr:hypothetical protein [Oscillospiraceae bacterium]